MQLALLTELVVQCPDERLRVAAVGLVKELILLKARSQVIPNKTLRETDRSNLSTSLYPSPPLLLPPLA